ncbi:hypothetical protein ACHMW6_03795 [Pseudoduganella sp. UC29_106]|uniref:hypothetical protein n=1 Tax=Pseudoduganella sp. UC29_106 TaxID=3374553 RepID=UPI003757FD49
MINHSIADLPKPGPKSAQMLIACGITSVEQVRQLGAGRGDHGSALAGSRAWPGAVGAAVRGFADVAATQCGFLHLPAGWFGELHPSPIPTWIFVLRGEMEFEATDGGTRRITPGSAVLLEDTTGRGHVSRVLGDEDAMLAVVRLPGNADAG